MHVGTRPIQDITAVRPRAESGQNIVLPFLPEGCNIGPDNNMGLISDPKGNDVRYHKDR